MSVEQTVNDFIQGVKAGKYEVVASTVDTCSGQPEFTFTVDVKDDGRLWAKLQTEWLELNKKTERLQSFINSRSSYNSLSVAERRLLFDQFNSMVDYQNILKQRMDLHSNDGLVKQYPEDMR